MSMTLRFLQVVLVAAVPLASCSSPDVDGSGKPDDRKANDGSASTQRGTLITVADTTTITVYKNPTCECCEKWAEHLRGHGFRVVIQVADDLDAVKKRHGVPDRLATCHTAVVNSYVVEGHVPADLVERLLRERPAIAGIAVPGMPRGVPGMDGPVKDRYDVIAFRHDGTSSIFARR